MAHDTVRGAHQEKIVHVMQNVGVITVRALCPLKDMRKFVE